MILNKPSGENWWLPNNIHIKYGIRVPQNSREASHFDKRNGNTLWDNATSKGAELSYKLCYLITAALFFPIFHVHPVRPDIIRIFWIYLYFVDIICT